MVEENKPDSERTVNAPAQETERPEPPAAEPLRVDEPLRDLDRGRAEFVAHLSRDFRTPLILLLGPLQDILASPASALAPSSRRVLETAWRNALWLLNLVDTLPDFSGPEGGRTAVDHEPADLAALIAELAENFRSSCDAAQLSLNVDCPPLTERVYVDREVWEKIVLNLVANAFKSTIDGTIDVRLRTQAGNAQLTVSDTGAGIPKGELPYVFDHDNRLPSPSTGTRDRIGFGLAFVQELVQLHGGSIEVRSTPGRGTSFTVVLPLDARNVSPGPGIQRRVDRGSVAFIQSDRSVVAEEPLSAGPHAEPTDAHTPTPDPVSRRRGHVVVAEDHADTRLYLSHVLETAGFTVDALANGRAALEACQIRPPDAVVSDVLMPGMDGFKLIERLRADKRTAVIPVLLLSARGGEGWRIEGIAAGADDYLVKPLSSRELVARVEGAVRLARLRRETARREEQRIKDLSGRLVEVQEAERRELSAELHDRTSPQLAAIQINLKMLNSLLSAGETEDIRALLDDTAGLIADTTTSIREISSNLRPTVLDDGGLLPALAGYAQQFTQRTGIVVQLDTKDSTNTLAPAEQSSLFRIVQEALTNCAKHAEAKTVTIRLSADGIHRVLLTVDDDGIGFDFEHQSTPGLGLVTMRERAEFLGGRFHLDTKPGHGTRIRVVVSE